MKTLALHMTTKHITNSFTNKMVIHMKNYSTTRKTQETRINDCQELRSCYLNQRNVIVATIQKTDINGG